MTHDRTAATSTARTHQLARASSRSTATGCRSAPRRRSSRCARATRRWSPAPTLSEPTGCDVYLKVEGANPTGSFKDRGMTMAISKAAEEGAKAVICASTGNTSAIGGRLRGARRHALRRARARRARSRSGKLAQALIHGAQAAAGRRQLRRLPRPGARARRATTRSRWSTRSTRSASRGRRPRRSRSCDALGDAPDVHCLPVGNAGNITAYWKGYGEYAADGVARRAPAHARLPGRRARRRSCSASRSPHPETHRHRDPDRQPGVAGSGAIAARDESGGADRRGHRRADPRGLPAARRAARASSSSRRRPRRSPGCSQARDGRACSTPGQTRRLHRHRPRAEGPASGRSTERRRRAPCPVDAQRRRGALGLASWHG